MAPTAKAVKAKATASRMRGRVPLTQKAKATSARMRGRVPQALKQERFLGLPGSWTFPGWSAIVRNLWNTAPDAALFPPKVYGFGWSFNFAYPTIRTKPWWARLAAFILGLVAVLVVLYAMVVLAMLLWFAIDIYVLGNSSEQIVIDLV